MPLTDTPFPTPFPPDLGAEIQRRTPRAGGGAEITHLHNATHITPLPILESAVLPFHPVRIVVSNSAANAYLRPAYCAERHIAFRNQPSGGFNIATPLISGENSMWEEPTPALVLADLRSFNYLEWETDQLGARTSNFNVVSYNTKQNSFHHIAPDPEDAGSNGVYKLELFRTDLSSTNSSNHVRLKWGGHFFIDQALWWGYHPEADSGADGKGRPYKRFDEDTPRYEFRVHAEAHGHNIVENSLNITHKFVGNNMGICSGNTINIYQGDDGTRDARFNILCERPSQPQVTLEQATKNSVGIIKGNNKDGTITFYDCNGNIVFQLTQIDGLGTWSGDHSLILGDCTNGAPNI